MLSGKLFPSHFELDRCCSGYEASVSSRIVAQEKITKKTTTDRPTDRPTTTTDRPTTTTDAVRRIVANNDDRRATSDKRRATSTERRAARDRRRAKIGEGRPAEQRTASDERRQMAILPNQIFRIRFPEPLVQNHVLRTTFSEPLVPNHFFPRRPFRSTLVFLGLGKSRWPQLDNQKGFKWSQNNT